ncbi:fumarate hydratase C-terminal domain-containing protein [Mollicutes bacterium LVI A0039]|nr:fumarate hydratase C-terminal domain-containing protein [Mollicutes bacterium LVI A0039]
MKTYYIDLPFTQEQLAEVRSGDLLYLSGDIYTARDAAHVRLHKSLKNGKCDLDLQDQVIYYVGPTPAFDDHIIGSCGPTTSSRMDRYTPDLMDAGLVATIGKGDRDQAIIDSCVRNHGLYLVATGGVGALLSSQISEYAEIMYQDLGPESLKRLKLSNFAVYVAYDTLGNDIFA